MDQDKNGAATRYGRIPLSDPGKFHRLTPARRQLSANPVVCHKLGGRRLDALLLVWFEIVHVLNYLHNDPTVCIYVVGHKIIDFLGFSPVPHIRFNGRE
jgi:hypothetical protein